MRPSRSSTRLAVPAFPDPYGPRDIREHSGTRASRSSELRRLLKSHTRGGRPITGERKRRVLLALAIIVACAVAAGDAVSAWDRHRVAQEQAEYAEWPAASHGH
jgi:hypothetical protein